MSKIEQVTEKKLTSKQSKCLILLLEGKSIQEISEALGVAIKSVYRYQESLEFKKIFAEAREKIFTEALEQLKEASKEAVKTLRELMKIGFKESARLGSAKTILELAIKNKELEELEKRIEVLEERLR